MSMDIEKLRAYIKHKHDKAYGTFLRETSGWCMEARIKHDSSARGVVDFSLELLNLINHGYEESRRMRPISTGMARDIAFGVNEDYGDCSDCLFDGYGCSGCSCAVGKVLKRLVNGGFLKIDENAEKEVCE